METTQDIKRECSLCGVDQTPLKGGISRINDRRGECLGLFGFCCIRAVYQAMTESPSRYGAMSRAEARELIYKRAKEIIKAEGGEG